MPETHYSIFFTGQMLFLMPNQQRQSTEGTKKQVMCYMCLCVVSQLNNEVH